MGMWSRFTTSLGFGRRASVAADLPSPTSPKRGPAAGRQVAPSDDLWVDHPGFGLVPLRLVRIFRAAEQGELAQQAALFDDQIEADGHVRSLLEGIEGAVHGKPLDIVADALDEESARVRDVLWSALDRLPAQQGLLSFIKHQSKRWRYGYANTEIEWGVIEEAGREWVVPIGLHSVEARRFYFDVKAKQFRLTSLQQPLGQELLPGKWIIGLVSPTDIARSGKMRTAARYCLLKSSAVTNWAVYGNKFGNPLALVKYDESEGENPKKVAEEIAKSIGSDAAAAVPKSIEVDIVEAGRMGDSSPLHGGMVAYLNSENSKVIAGGTLTNDSSGASGREGNSSHALGKVHENSRWGVISAAALDLQETFYELSRLFVAFNGLTGIAAPPRLQIQIARDWTPTTIVQAASMLINECGVKVSTAQLYANTGFAAPENDADATPGRKAGDAPTAPPTNEDQ